MAHMRMPLCTTVEAFRPRLWSNARYRAVDGVFRLHS